MQSRPWAMVKVQHPDGSASFCTLSQGQASFDPDARYLAKKLDDDWFRSHPHRSHRIRRAIPGESPSATMQTYIVVRQYRPGVRQRVTFNPFTPFPGSDAPEHIAHAFLISFRGLQLAWFSAMNSPSESVHTRWAATPKGARLEKRDASIEIAPDPPRRSK
jgi:hypothetical protein